MLNTDELTVDYEKLKFELLKSTRTSYHKNKFSSKKS